MKKWQLFLLSTIWLIVVTLLMCYESLIPKSINLVISALFVFFWIYVLLSNDNNTVIEDEEDNWISVNDQLPEKGQYVLLYGKGARQFTALFDDKGRFMCYNPFNEELEEAEEITHWQPLPKKPKKK